MSASTMVVHPRDGRTTTAAAEWFRDRRSMTARPAAVALTVHDMAIKNRTNIDIGRKYCFVTRYITIRNDCVEKHPDIGHNLYSI